MTYRYRVKALNGGGASGASNQASVAYPIGTDATLSALTLSAGALWPAFASGTTVYAAAAADTVMRIAVTPAPTDGNATVAFLDGNDAALDDADSATDGHQVDLDMGANVFKVKVTAEDGVATETYTVTVTREASVRICARTEQVRATILAAAQVSATDCAFVLPGELARIAVLDLTSDPPGTRVPSLQAGDFHGLTGLRTLKLIGNHLPTLPAGVFDELTGLTTLDLDDNRFTELPAGIFDELTSLTKLDLCSGKLTSLRPGVFDRLTNLTILNLYFNPLTALPAGVFDQLTQLRELRIYGTHLTELRQASSTA